MSKYANSLKEVVSGWTWASPERIDAVCLQISKADLYADSPEKYLTDLITMHKADAANHVPQFDKTLNRYMNRYRNEVGKASDSEELLDRIVKNLP